MTPTGGQPGAAGSQCSAIALDGKLAAMSTSGDSTEFWSVIATTIPVLALALTVEFRGSLKTLYAEREMPAIWAFLHFVLFTGAALGEGHALSILAGDRADSPGFKFPIMALVGSMLAMLIANPLALFGIAFANYLGAAWGLFTLPSLRYRMLRARLRLWRSIRKQRRLVRRGMRIISKSAERTLKAIDIGEISPEGEAEWRAELLGMLQEIDFSSISFEYSIADIRAEMRTYVELRAAHRRHLSGKTRRFFETALNPSPSS